MAEWTASTPYATNRIASLHRFARDPLYLTWAQRFAQSANTPVVTEPGDAVYAGFCRRARAFGIDVLIIQTLVPAAHAVQTRYLFVDLAEAPYEKWSRTRLVSGSAAVRSA